MKHFLIFSLFIITSCASSKYSYSYFVDCEKKFSEFTNLSSCALKNIQKDCNDNINCRNGNTRFVDAIKRLQIMVQKNEISDNTKLLLDKFHEGLDFYHNQEWDKAIDCFTKSDKLEEDFPGRKTNPSKVFIKRSKLFKESPPDKDWDGTFALDSK